MLETQAIGAPIAITQGDCAGIGPEIIAQAFRQAPEAMAGCFVVGELQTMRRATALAAGGGMAQAIAVMDGVADWRRVPPGSLGLLALPGLPGPQPYGQLSAAAGEAAARCVVWAAQAALRGDAELLRAAEKLYSNDPQDNDK